MDFDLSQQKHVLHKSLEALALGHIVIMSARAYAFDYTQNQYIFDNLQVYDLDTWNDISIGNILLSSTKDVALGVRYIFFAEVVAFERAPERKIMRRYDSEQQRIIEVTAGGGVTILRLCIYGEFHGSTHEEPDPELYNSFFGIEEGEITCDFYPMS
jgi:hypothetical protein